MKYVGWIIKFINFVKDLFLENILLVFALSIMVEHIQNTLNKADYVTIPSWWEKIRLDYNEVSYIYIAFIIVLGLWAINKTIHIIQNNKKTKKMYEVIMNLEKFLSQMEKDKTDNNN